VTHFIVLINGQFDTFLLLFPLLFLLLIMNHDIYLNKMQQRLYKLSSIWTIAKKRHDFKKYQYNEKKMIFK
jgi:hypothetical protein